MKREKQYLQQLWELYYGQMSNKKVFSEMDGSIMGSGSTIEACIRTERNYIGIEINKEFYHHTENRISSLCGGLFSNSFQTKLSNVAGT